MTIYLSHQSALRYWLTKTGDECLPDGADDRSLVWATSNAREISRERMPFDFSERRPLHVLVPSREAAHDSNRVTAHVWRGPVPPGSFYQLLGTGRVSSPEFAFVQMAARRPLLASVELGCYLCGSFSITDKGRDYAGRRLELTTPEQLRRYVESMPGAYGTVRALEALVYVVPGTASPMEVLLVLAFVLPPRLGGWDMPQICANQRIEVDEHLRAIAGASYFVGDLYMPSVRGNVEYDSYEFHTGKYRLDRTQARRNVLEAMGIKTVSASWGQISSFEKFETFMWMVKDRFGIPQREFTADERVAQMMLYDHLTSRTATLF